MIGIIGAGGMGRAIALRINQKLIISDVDRAKLKFGKNRRLVAARNNIDLARRAKIIIVAVKPQHIVEVIKEIRPYVKDKLIISIAAGVTTDFIERRLAEKTKLIRVMPNMPALVGKGITAVTRGRFSTAGDLGIARKIFLNLGEVIEVKERFMDAVTAVGGSGPAYYFLFTYLLEKAGESCGLKKAVARRLARSTFIGAAESAACIDLSMQEFVKKVASKGGTTERALRIFKKRGLGRIVNQAVKAAYNRSRGLSKKGAA